MNCIILGLSQQMNFEKDTLEGFMSLRLPTGDVIQCSIDDDTAARVVAARMGTTATRAPAPAAPPPVAGPMEFGGDFAPAAPAGAGIDATVDDEDESEEVDDGVASV